LSPGTEHIDQVIIVHGWFDGIMPGFDEVRVVFPDGDPLKRAMIYNKIFVVKDFFNV
jgi:hypothetical protein